VVLDDATELPFDLFLGVPRHCPPPVAKASGLVEEGWIPVNLRTLETKFPNVFAVGDLANAGTPKAGVFAEAAAKAVASGLIARVRGEGEGTPNTGKGSCYFEFGAGRIASVDIDFLSGPKPKFQLYCSGKLIKLAIGFCAAWASAFSCSSWDFVSWLRRPGGNRASTTRAMPVPNASLLMVQFAFPV
jgi:NADPH-dependent 2,4-dienoyl-CoA reductase/sulfur reductase-like enzyme